MVKNDKEEGGSEYDYILPLAIVLISWGIVPAFAKIGNLPGDVTTLYVNLFATLALVLWVTIEKKWRLFNAYSLKDYEVMIGIGLVWPLLYSVAYFEAIQQGGAALTTVLNYTWPAFYLGWLFLIRREKKSQLSVYTITLAVIAVGLSTFLDSKKSFVLAPLGIALGLSAAACQGFYIVVTERKKYDVLIMTLIIEAVTVSGVSLLVALRGTFVIPKTNALFCFAAIGVIGNAVGFWALLKGNKKSSKDKEKAKDVWLIGLSFVPFVQVLILRLLGLESISVYKWLGIILVALSLVINKTGKLLFFKSKEEGMPGCPSG